MRGVRARDEQLSPERIYRACVEWSQVRSRRVMDAPRDL